MRFSRRTLNIIIVACVAVVAWLQLTLTPTPESLEQQPLADLPLAPLPEVSWHHWHSQEGIAVYWQQTSLPQGHIRAIDAAGHYQDIALAAQQWQTTLTQKRPSISQQQTTALLLQGPWQPADFQAIAAWLISSAQLVAAAENQQAQRQQSDYQPQDSCERNYPVAASWFRDGWPIATTHLAAPQAILSRPLPKRQQWQQFRQQQSQQLRQQWLSHAGQLDIQSHIAYHRLPSDYYPTLYRALAQRQKTAARDYLSCRQQQISAGQQRE